MYTDVEETERLRGWGGGRKRYGIGEIVRQEIFAGVYFCGVASFCVFRELIFAIFIKSRRNH